MEERVVRFLKPSGAGHGARILFFLLSAPFSYEFLPRCLPYFLPPLFALFPALCGWWYCFSGTVSKKSAVPSREVILLCVMTLFRGDTISKNSVENPVKHKGTRGNRPSQKTKLEAAASSRADQLETSFRTERNPSAKKTTQNFPIPAFQSPRRVQQESSLSVENSISKASRSKEKQQKWYHQKNRK